MPRSSELAADVTVDFTHQDERSRAVPCRDCHGTTWNHHAICDHCLDKGSSISCHSVCAEVVRAAAGQARTNTTDRSGSPQDRGTPHRAAPSEPGHHQNHGSTGAGRCLVAFAMSLYLLILCCTVGTAIGCAGLVSC